MLSEIYNHVYGKRQIQVNDFSEQERIILKLCELVFIDDLSEDYYFFVKIIISKRQVKLKLGQVVQIANSKNNLNAVLQLSLIN